MMKIIGNKRFLVLLVLLLLLLTGCHTPPGSELVEKIFRILLGAEALQVFFRKAGRKEVNFYLRRRISWLIGEHSDWDEPPAYPVLTTRLENEMSQIINYINEKLGTSSEPGPLGVSSEPNQEMPHTNLRDIAHIYLDDPEDRIDQRTASYVNARRERVRMIVWRALAIHPELWTNNDSPNDVSFHETALEELLDRRLRFVERMIYTDKAHGERGLQGLNWTFDSSSSGWRDGRRTVLFEYPFIDNTDNFKRAVSNANLDIQTIGYPYFVNKGFQIRYIGGGHPSPPTANHWDAESEYAWTLHLHGKTAAEVFDLFIPSTSPVPDAFQDFWHRNWIFCDQMAAALIVDALRFGLKRRTNSDVTFNEAVARGLKLGVPVSPAFGVPDPNNTMTVGTDFLEGAAVESKDLQVGDLLIVWNNFFLRRIIGTDFGLENCAVAGMFGENPQNAVLVGHGVTMSSYKNFLENLLDLLINVVNLIQRSLTKTINDTDPQLEFLITGASINFPLNAIQRDLTLEVVYWPPYGEQFQPANGEQIIQIMGAWWIRIKLEDTASGDNPALTLEQALIFFPNAVAIDTSTFYHEVPPYLPDHHPDYKESIYIPLSVPKGYKGGWAAYFQKVKEDRESDLPPPATGKLEDVKVDASWAPGFYTSDLDSNISILRPKIRI